MKYDPDIHKRRSMRLKDYDYSNQGAYFVTICVKHRKSILGNLVNGNMVLNDAGLMVQKTWDELNDKYEGINTDEFIIMPNHIHGIIFIVGAGPCACPDITRSGSQGHPQGGAPTLSLSDVVHRFKSYTTAQYRIGVEIYNWDPFPGKLWQRNYYDRIIRNEQELTKIRGYIRNNPSQWEMDEENPAFVNNQDRS